MNKLVVSQTVCNRVKQNVRRAKFSGQKCLCLLLAIFLFACKGEDRVIWGECFDCAVIHGYPVWSPDGKWIAYVRGSATYLIRPDGSNNILWHNRVVKAAWSPCSQWITFSEYGRIWKKRIDGSSLTQLTEEISNSNPAWSPDGKKIAFYNTGGGIWILDLENDTIYQSYSGLVFDFVWIDNKNIILGQPFSEENVPVTRLCLLDTETNTYHKISSLSQSPRNFSFCYTNSKMLFTQGVSKNQCYHLDLWIINADGTEPRKLLEYSSFASWHPDGN